MCQLIVDRVQPTQHRGTFTVAEIRIAHAVRHDDAQFQQFGHQGIAGTPVFHGRRKGTPPAEQPEQTDQAVNIVGMVLPAQESIAGGAQIDFGRFQREPGSAVATRNGDGLQKCLEIVLLPGVGQAMEVQDRELLCLGVPPLAGRIGAGRIHDLDGGVTRCALLIPRSPELFSDLSVPGIGLVHARWSIIFSSSPGYDVQNASPPQYWTSDPVSS